MVLFGKAVELEYGVEIEGKGGCVEPRSTCSKVFGWNVPSRKLLLQAVVDLLGLPATLLLPRDDCGTIHFLFSRKPKESSIFPVLDVAGHSEELVYHFAEFGEVELFLSALFLFEDLNGPFKKELPAIRRFLLWTVLRTVQRGSRFFLPVDLGLTPPYKAYVPGDLQHAC